MTGNFAGMAGNLSMISEQLRNENTKFIQENYASQKHDF